MNLRFKLEHRVKFPSLRLFSRIKDILQQSDKAVHLVFIDLLLVKSSIFLLLVALFRLFIIGILLVH